jgi:uncharacterized protein (DUF2461 family)
MDAKRILQFLKEITVNNNRQWFQEHKDEYEVDRWLSKSVAMLRTAKPMMDFMNSVIDDYE